MPRNPWLIKSVWVAGSPRNTQVTDKWHLDEVVITFRGVRHWLWRAVDNEGQTLDILVQARRIARAARRFISRLVPRWGVPRVIITDKLRSYRAILRTPPGHF